MKRSLFIILFFFGLHSIGWSAWDGATNYPTALDDSASLYDVEDSGTVEDEHHDAPVQAIIAIEGKVGTGASTPTDGTVLLGTGVGTSAWGQVDLTADVTGVLPDANVANDITIDLATLATTLTISDNESTNENNAILFTAGGDLDGGNLGIESDGTLYYNPSTGIVTATGFAGALTGNITGNVTGNVTGDLTGNVTGNVSGTAATVTGATQANITTLANVTTVGTIGAGTWQGTAIGTTYAGTDLDASNLGATLTMSDGDLLDFSGITMTDTVAEGLTIPDCPASGNPNTDKNFICYDAAGDRFLAWEQGVGWVDTSSGAGAGADDSFITWENDGDLSNDRILIGGTGIALATGAPNATLTLDATEIDAVTWSDGANASNIWTFDLSGTDVTMTVGSGLTTFSGRLASVNGIDIGTDKTILGVTAMTIGNGTQTVAINSSNWDIGTTGDATGFGTITATNFTIGSAGITEAELEIIDGATLGTADLNIIDGISDSGTLTDTELLYVDGVTSAIQTQLDARALESVVGTSLEADDLELNGTTLQLVAEIPHSDAALDISGTWEIQDSVNLNFGAGADVGAMWDHSITATDITDFPTVSGDALLISGTDAVDTMKVIIENDDATQTAALYVDKIYANTVESTATSGDSKITYATNATITGSGYETFFEGTPGDFTIVENGQEKLAVNTYDGFVMLGSATTVDMDAVTNLTVPSSADAAGEIGVDDSTDIFSIGIQDGAGAFVSFDFTGIDGNDTYVMAWDEASNVFTAQAQAGGGGDTSWDDLGDPDAGQPATFGMGASGETTTFTMSADNTEILYDFTGAFTTAASPDLFKIIQQTGNTEAVTLLTLQASDSDVTVFEAGDGTNVWTISPAGLLAGVGTSSFSVGTTASATGLISTGVGLDGIGAVDLDYGSADITDHTFTTDDSTFIIDGGITVSTGDTITLGSTAWNSGDNIDGEVIDDDTIDDDSIDFADVTAADITMTDAGAITSSGVITATTSVITPLLDAAGDEDMDYGSADVDDHTFITDGTGTAEIVLPAGSIDGTEILDDTITEPDLNSTNAATDNYVLSYNAAGTNFTWVEMTGGAETNSLETTVTGIADTEFFVGDGADSGAFVTMSGDATLANTGALSLATNVVAAAEMADADHGDVSWTSGVATVEAVSGANSVDSDAYVDGSIDIAHMSTDSVDYDNTTGSIKSLTPVTDDADNFAANFTGANLYGGTFVANATGTAQLPAVAAGMNFCIITLGAIAVNADVNASDSQLLDGVQLDDGDQATNTSTAGDIICYQYYSAAGWVSTSNGWTDGS